MKDLETRLLDMKDKIKEAKSNHDKTQGAIDQLLTRLKTEFNLNDTKEAKQEILNLEEEIDKLNRDCEQQVAKLEKDYDWS